LGWWLQIWKLSSDEIYAPVSWKFVGKFPLSRETRHRRAAKSAFRHVGFAGERQLAGHCPFTRDFLQGGQKPHPKPSCKSQRFNADFAEILCGKIGCLPPVEYSPGRISTQAGMKAALGRSPRDPAHRNDELDRIVRGA